MVKLAGGLGFEPRLAESESAVLPLDDPPRIGGLGVIAGWGLGRKSSHAPAALTLLDRGRPPSLTQGCGRTSVP